MEYNRAIRLRNDTSVTRVELADDFHQFSIEMTHRDGHIVGVRGTAGRTPWSTCGGAPGVLPMLIGQRLDPVGLPLSPSDRSEQCLHLLDMVELAVAHALRDEPDLHYDIRIVRGDRREDPIDAKLARNGRALFSWQIGATQIAAPAPFDAFPIETIGALKRDTVVDWCRDKLDAATTEAVLVLHRALFVSTAKYVDWSSPRSSAEHNVPHFCFTHHKKRATVAFMTPGDFNRPASPAPDR